MTEDGAIDQQRGVQRPRSDDDNGEGTVVSRTLQLRIRGRVQGVGYRAFLCGEGEARGITGWVRNRRDGSVEAELTGDTAALDALVDAARRGPPGGVVTAVEATDARPPDRPATGISILPTT
jgi:acylphosphatase